MAKGKQRKGRGRPSSIDAIPADLRLALDEALRDRRLTQQEILAQFNGLLADREAKPLSRSALNRYATHIEEKVGLLREAREAADAIVGKLDSPGGDIGLAVTELVKTLTFDVVVRAKSDKEPVSVDLLKQLATISERVERASKLGVDRELKIREEAAARAKREAADAMVAIGSDKGVSSEVMDQMIDAVLGGAV